jgi:hypothetical protein
MKTTQDIIQEHQRNASALLIGYQDALSEIRESRDLEDGAYLDRLTDEQRMSVLRERKAERASEAHQQTLEVYREEVQRYQDELAQRRAHLKKRLFSVEGPDGAAALSRAITATEGELAAYLDVAEQAGNQDLARAAFVAAERRGLGDLMHRFFDEVDQEAGTFYQEWSQLPPGDVLQCQRESIERVVQPPDYERLMPPARVSAY